MLKEISGRRRRRSYSFFQLLDNVELQGATKPSWRELYANLLVGSPFLADQVVKDFWATLGDRLEVEVSV